MVDALPQLPTGGGPVSVVRTSRTMKHYTVFDSDFESLATNDTATTFCMTVSSFCFAFGLDIFKDTALAQSIPASTQVALGYIQPMLFVFSFLFAAGAFAFWRKKRSKIQSIKDDCVELEVEVIPK